VELNVHSLVVFILSLQAVSPSESNNFIPWQLSSQCCEKVFRSARSMSSVFSTIINFGMLGLLQRFHRLHVQEILESEAKENEINYSKMHKRKESNYLNSGNQNIASITLEDISRTVGRACAEAKKTIDELEMSELLKTHNMWE